MVLSTFANVAKPFEVSFLLKMLADGSAQVQWGPEIHWDSL